MGKLWDKIYKLVNSPLDASSLGRPPLDTDECDKILTDQILAAVLEHIEGVERPENLADDAAKHGDPMACEFANGFEAGVSKDREKIEESLKGEIGK